MIVEQDHVISRGNIWAEFNRFELKIGLAGSLSKKRETLHRGLESFAEIVRSVEVMLGYVPDVTVGWTSKEMAEFVEKRFGVDVTLEEIKDNEGKVHIVHRVIGDTRGVMNIVSSLIVDDNLTNAIKLGGA